MLLVSIKAFLGAYCRLTDAFVKKNVITLLNLRTDKIKYFCLLIWVPNTGYLTKATIKQKKCINDLLHILFYLI